MKDFYTTFENEYRGSRELIKARGKMLLPFIMPLIKIDKKAKALDLGCGRGEWLEILQEQGFTATGIDINKDMLQYARELNLTVEHGEALPYLRDQEKENFNLITAFHVIEHISFEQLFKWISEIYRILTPGGILIFETPNPGNILVATSNFYLDPTHIRPLPPELLEFTLKFIGFERIKIVYLHESSTLKTEDIFLNTVLTEVSPDYAVIAQKKARIEILTKFDAPFNQNYGIKLTELANLYDQRVEGRLNAAEVRINETLRNIVKETNKTQNNIQSIIQKDTQLELAITNLAAQTKKDVEVVKNEQMVMNSQLRDKLTQELINLTQAQANLAEQTKKDVEVARNEQMAMNSQLRDKLTQELINLTQAQANLAEQTKKDIEVVRNEQMTMNSQLRTQLEQVSKELSTMYQDFEKSIQEMNQNIQSELISTQYALDEHKTNTNQIVQELHSVHQSKSWKMTKPLRELNLFFNNFFQFKNNSLRLRNKVQWLFRRKNIQNIVNIESIAKNPIRIAIDLTPVISGGANGGAKVMVLELIKSMSKLDQNKFYILLTSQRSHDELASLDAKNVKRICVLDENLQLVVSKNIAIQLKANLLFCPFTYSVFSNKAIPTVCIIYDLQYKYYPRFFNTNQINEREYAFNQACHHADRLICISNYVRNTILEQKTSFNKNHIITIPCIIPKHIREEDSKKVSSLLQNLKLIDNQFLLYPANFWQHKNHEILLIAFSIYCHQNPNNNLKLVLTGHPCERAIYLQKAVVKMKLNNKVLFLNYVDSNTLAVLMTNCLAVIFPSLYEGFGMPVLEAIVCEKPVLCSDATSLPEIASNAALFFDPRRPDKIADLIQKVSQSAELRQELIQREKNLIKEIPTGQQISEKYLAVFNDVLSEKGVNEYV